jgi:putative membrane protein
VLVKKFLQTWVINTLGVLVAVYVLGSRIHYQRPIDLCVASLLLGILNAVVRPILLRLVLPLLVLTLGLFTFFINALLLYLVSAIMQPYFSVAGFWGAFWGAIIISIVSLILNILTGNTNTRIKFERHRRPPDVGPGGNGPVIDI